MLINPEGSPFYIFRHYATFFERKQFFQKFQFFSKKNLLRFSSLRYGADFRRSRLVGVYRGLIRLRVFLVLLTLGPLLCFIPLLSLPGSLKAVK